jgi:serine/threonine protein kinase/tetratricopeptide (TPR) repeat protein
MTPARWQQVQRVFHEAVALEPPLREAYLASACGADAALRDEVAALLAADAAPIPVLDQARKALAAFLETDAAAAAEGAGPELPAGARLGPYRLLHEIGRGGMGTVYLAERDDAHFARRVAVKLVGRGLESDTALRRFRHERQILAALEHPNIARLYDGGVSDDGRPYLVLEYVEGAPLDRYCDAHRLSVDARLALFESVCEAVRYAHRNLVVHRDLKPSNILVTPEGQVKLLDFGIAKLLDEDAAADDAPLTRTGMRVMTPAYAAPEQVRGEPVTTATDVYALGVVLYELLTGERPYGAAGTSRYALERAVLEQTPERPSTAVGRAGADLRDGAGAARGTSPAHLRRRLRGDLDTVLLTALRKEPERRYASADALLEDLRRHRAGLPLRARQDTVGYRLGKFVRRNRWLVAAGVVVLLSLVSVLGAALWQGRRAAHERDVAVQVSAFLESVLSASDPTRTDAERLDTLRVRDLLDRSAQTVRQELGTQPQVLAQMLHILGRVYVNLGLYDRAQPLLEEALALRRGLYGPADPAVTETEETLGLLSFNQGRYDAAERLRRHVLSVRRRPGTDDRLHARALRDLGSSLQQEGAFEEAATHYREALDLLAGTDRDTRIAYGEVANDLASVYHQRGDYAAAEPLLRDVVAIHRETLGPRHPHVAKALNALASTLHYMGRLEDAGPLYEASLALWRDVYGEQHPEVSLALQNLATYYDERGLYDRSDSLYRASLRIDRALLGPDHPDVAFTMRNHALSRYEFGDYDAAEQILREALPLLRENLPPDHLYTVATQVSLGKVLTAQGDLAEAERLLRQGLPLLLGQLPADHFLISAVRSDLGVCLKAQGRFAEAEPLLVQGYTALQASRGGRATITREALQRLVGLYDAWGRPAEADRYRALLAAAP